MEQIPGTTTAEPPTQVQQDAQPAGATPADPSGFRARGRMRRRARYLRTARELAYRDLGGLVYNLHRFGQRNDALVLAKLGVLGQIDDELRALEHALDEREPITVLREAGITACPRCAAIHAGEDRYCPNCGLPMGRNPDLPIAVVAPASTSASGAAIPSPAPPAAGTPVPASVPAKPPTVTAAPSPARPPATGTSAPNASGGRSPAPPGSPGTPGADAPAEAGVAPPEPVQASSAPGSADPEAEATEIIRPPAAGS